MPLHLDAKLRFCIFPQRCQISNNRIWFKTAYKIVEQYYDPRHGNKVASTHPYWVDKHEYMIDRLRS